MDPPPGCNEVERDLFVSPTQFENQMADLCRRGLRSVTLDEFRHSDDGTVLITFDDGYATVAQTVTPILAKYGFKATMFVPAAYISGHNEADAGALPNIGELDIVSREQISTMVAGPWQIASHGFRHVDLRAVDDNRRLWELKESRSLLGEITGKSVDALAYPYGSLDDGVEESARGAGYTMAFTALPARAARPLRIPRYPIRGTDDMAVFRLKTSGWLRRLHSVYAMAPARARATIRAALNGVGALAQ